MNSTIPASLPTMFSLRNGGWRIVQTGSSSRSTIFLRILRLPLMSFWAGDLERTTNLSFPRMAATNITTSSGPNLLWTQGDMTLTSFAGFGRGQSRGRLQCIQGFLGISMTSWPGTVAGLLQISRDSQSGTISPALTTMMLIISAVPSQLPLLGALRLTLSTPYIPRPFLRQAR